MKFTEAKLEASFTELPGQKGFAHQLGITVLLRPMRDRDRQAVAVGRKL